MASNKELAVQLYSALIQAHATNCSNPNYTGKMGTPSFETAAREIQELTQLLANVKEE